eukprot:3465580-Prymnesium_polylepis.2
MSSGLLDLVGQCISVAFVPEANVPRERPTATRGVDATRLATRACGRRARRGERGRARGRAQRRGRPGPASGHRTPSRVELSVCTRRTRVFRIPAPSVRSPVHPSPSSRRKGYGLYGVQ